jgi:HPt (histidine-containing phosphotransfer) domain-containing protein
MTEYILKDFNFKVLLDRIYKIFEKRAKSRALSSSLLSHKNIYSNKSGKISMSNKNLQTSNFAEMSKFIKNDEYTININVQEQYEHLENSILEYKTNSCNTVCLSYKSENLKTRNSDSKLIEFKSSCQNLEIKRENSCNKKTLLDEEISQFGFMTEIEHFNYYHLFELSDGNKIFEKEFIEVFLHSVQHDIKLLESYILEENINMIKSLVHKLKTPLTIMGLVKLENLISSIEYLYKTKSNQKEIIDLLDNLKKNMDIIYEEVKEILKK